MATTVCLSLTAGSAYLIERIQDKQLFLGKKIAMDMLSEKEKEDAVNEATMLKSLNHPNIVSYYNSYMDSNQLIIVMQYCEGKSTMLTQWEIWLIISRREKIRTITSQRPRS